ncbi:C39 family peptidase [Sporosarcina sp. 179-K 3D1 HS]|uniref:C39 family peptidase n=1 Tax=Sporosarcina sp. 179-K 3D1 HS TaxID=3232169 RepID=UPI0039A19909
MKRILNIQGKSQYDEDIKDKFRPSACGPVTAYVLLRHLLPQSLYQVNELYRLLGSTRIGLFKWRFLRNLRKLLGPGWHVVECGIAEVQQQIHAGRPVAAKFDKWFSRKWRGQYTFNYHWVPVIGYEKTEDDILLIIHDNGSRRYGSRIRQVSYQKNQEILSFIKMEPKA